MMSQHTRPPQLIISGFHRSGTSLTAQYLHLAGLNLGRNLLGANPSNPDGHFEDHDVVALHKDILSANHREWYTPGPDLSSDAGTFEVRAKALMKAFPTDQPMGFKDPRSSLLLPWWHKQLENPAAVIVYRHYMGCFHSLRNRQAQHLVFAPSQADGALFFWQQPELALELWLSYNNAILDYVNDNRETTLLVSHHSMLNGFNLPAAVNKTMGLTLDTECESAIRSGENRKPEKLPDVNPELAERLEAAMSSLNALCFSEPEPDYNSNCAIGEFETRVKVSINEYREAIENSIDKLNIPGSTIDNASKPKLPDGNKAKNSVAIAGSAIDSEEVTELILWGRMHQADHSYEEAERCWSRARSIAPRNASPVLQLALLARNRGEHEKTVQLMQEAIELKPNNAGFHVHLARALKYCQKIEQALEVVRNGLALQADHSDLHLLQLDLLLSLDRPLAARSACREARMLFPDDERFMRVMVRLAEIDRDSQSAMAWFRRSILARIKQHKEYRKTLRDAMNLVPDNQQPALSHRVIDELQKLNIDPESGKSRPKTQGTWRLAMSILVRDEADIIRDNILYHASAGVDHFIVTDNGSIDGTREILEELKQTVDLIVIDEPSHTIDQDLWVTRMAHHMRDANIADWIINNDADEFWLSHTGTLKEAIVNDLTKDVAVGLDIGTLYCQRFNLIPSAEAVEQSEYRFYDNHYKVTATLYESAQSSAWHENNSNSLIRTLPGKVISRLEGLDSIDMGNHGAQHTQARLDSSNVSIAHYPVRNYSQFERKVVNYGKSLSNNSRFEQNVSRHLRYWFEQYKIGKLHEEYRKFVLPESRLEQLVGEGILTPETRVAASVMKHIEQSFGEPSRLHPVDDGSNRYRVSGEN